MENILEGLWCMVKAIIITGTPGSGKTTIAKKLAKELKAEYVDVNKLVKEFKLIDGYDKKRKCKIVDVKKLVKVLVKLVRNSKKRLVIDSHLSHFLDKRYVEVCIVTKCNLKTLKKRLIKRKYSFKKVRENLDAEIFDVCLNEAIEIGHKIKVIDTSKKIKKLIKNL